MADKSISELTVSQAMTDDALLVTYQSGDTKSIEGLLIKQYARESTKQYIEGAKQSAQDAAASAEAAKTAREGVEAYEEQAGQSATQAAGSASAAQSAATAAETSKTAAAGSAASAEKSAGEALASKTAAASSETNAAASAAAAGKSKTDAESAQAAAESAKATAETSAISAESSAAVAGEKAVAAAESAKAAAGAETAAGKAKTDAESARDGAQSAKSAAETARTGAETAKSAAESARDGAKASETAAKASETAAKASETGAAASAATATEQAESAGTKSGEAAASAGAAKDSETKAKASETAAGESADAAEQARQAIEALGVEGVTLPAGGQVAVEKAVAADGTVTLKFSIPQGAKGDKGDQGERGVSITSIERTGGTGAAGTTDTYTITLSNGSASTFQIYNGKDGNGSGDMLAAVYDPTGRKRDMFAAIDAKADTDHVHTASDVTFTDGETFQVKYDAGELTGPAGAAGPAGKDGIAGPAGPAGAAGKSAYQQAVAGGYTGTEAEFQEILGSGPWLPVSGGSITGTINMFGNAIHNISMITAPDDVRKIQVQSGLNMWNNSISNVAAPTDSSDAANKEYVDSKAAKSVTVTLSTAGWTGSGPYAQTVSVTGLLADQKGDIGLSQSATADQRAAARDAMISVTGQAAGTITVTADGEKPAVDIPAVVTMLG